MKFPITLIILSITTKAFGFIVQPSSPSSLLHTNSIFSISGCESSTSATVLCAKKKRRRRKESSSPPPPTPQVNEDDELPDFDLVEDIDLQSSTNTPKSTMTSSSTSGISASPAPVKKKAFDVNDPDVIAAMKAPKGSDSVGSPTSTKDLLRKRNRELEQKLVADEIVEDVPSFADYNAKKGNRSGGNNTIDTGSGMGKKAMKREQRRAAALEAEGNNLQEEENVVSQLLSKLPFVNNDEGEKEEKSAVKLLEEGTWACIYILVAWEFYINTPLFNRAAPMAPVVFQDPVTTTFLL